MAALTKGRITTTREGRDCALGVAASTRIWQGAIVCRNAAGWAVPGSVSTTLKALGVAGATADNSNGANGDAFVRVERGRWFLFAIDGADPITAADLGNTAFITDDQTVCRTNGGGTKSAAGVIRDVADGGVWIEFA